MAIAGLYIGTTGAKITVFDEAGAELFAGYRDYPATRVTGAHEINAEGIRDAVLKLLAEAAHAVAELSAVGVASFGESFVLLDDNDSVLLPAILYTDPRGGEELRELTDALGDAWLRGVTGLSPHPMFSLPKLMWIRKNRPEIYKQIKYVMQMEDYVCYLLTGERVVDYSLATRIMAFDLDGLCWNQRILDAAGVDAAWLSKPVPSGAVAGTLRPELRRSLGLSRDVAVVACCQDQVAAAIGSGVLQGGLAADGAGTVECVTPVFRRDELLGDLTADGYVRIPYLRGGLFVTYAFTFTGGALVRWFIDTLGGEQRAEAARRGVSVYELLEGGMRDEPTGMLALPHFAGAATPHMDTDAKGVIVGLTLATGASDVYRALMEGVCYEMALNVERLRAAGIRVGALHATGGGAKSRLWLQMKADVLGLPVRRMRADEAGTVGVIMLTGVATGAYPSLEAAAEVFIGVKETFLPRPEAHERYAACYRRYRALYDAVRPLM